MIVMLPDWHLGRAHSFYHIHSIDGRSVFAFHSDDHDFDKFAITIDKFAITIDIIVK